MTEAEICGFENYPWYIVLIRDLVVALWVVSGAFTMMFLGDEYAVAYLVYAFAVALFTLAFVCRRCFYFGRFCDNGLGKVSKVLFRKKADEKEYGSWAERAVPPLIILWLAPLIAGFAAKNIDNWFFVYIASLALFFLTAPFLACGRCRMRDRCPVCMGGKR